MEMTSELLFMMLILAFTQFQMPLLDICNDLLDQKKFMRDKLDARRKEFVEILKFKEEMNEFWQEVLHVSGFTLFLDECER